MSCGRPHEVDCAQVLARVFAFIDGELAGADVGEISQHLAECAPCLRDYDVERMIKGLVARSCGCESAPPQLRDRVMLSIHQLNLQVSDPPGRPGPFG